MEVLYYDPTVARVYLSRGPQRCQRCMYSYPSYSRKVDVLFIHYGFLDSDYS
jgi:hypothetical protein